MSDRAEDRTVHIGERLVIAGIDGVDRTFELAEVGRERPPLGGKRREYAKLVDTGIRPTLVKAGVAAAGEACEHVWLIADDPLEHNLANRLRYCGECWQAEFVGPVRKTCGHRIYFNNCRECAEPMEVS